MQDEQAETTEVEIEQDIEQNGDETQEAPASPLDDTSEAEEVVVTIGEEQPPQEEHAQAPEWVRELRKSHRQLAREKRELEEKLKAATQPQQTATVLGQKPTLEQFDYDADQYESALAAWFDRKAKVDAEAAQARLAEEESQRAWQEKLNGYNAAKAALKVRDYEDAEVTVAETLNVTQQGVILQGAENPALLIYALGKNSTKAKELASITDPVKFAFAVAKLETQLKVQNRKATPPPEKTVKGTGPVSGAVDSTLERLRAEAEKTGDYSKVYQYRRQNRK